MKSKVSKQETEKKNHGYTGLSYPYYIIHKSCRDHLLSSFPKHCLSRWSVFSCLCSDPSFVFTFIVHVQLISIRLCWTVRIWII